jgi:hypothetical protein
VQDEQRIRLRRAGIATGLTVFATGVSMWFANERGVLLEASIIPAFMLFVGALATYSIWSGKAYELPPPPSEQPPAPSRPAKPDSKLEERWYFRYPFAAAGVALAVSVADGTPWLAALLVVGAAVMCWELVLFAVAAGLAYMLVGALAAIPISIALIIGAVIIAGAISRRR